MVKRIISAVAGLACAVMLMTGGSMVTMAEVNTPLPEFGQFYGTVTKEGDSSLLLNTQDRRDIVLHISDSTKILDAVDALPISFDDITDGEAMYAYTSQAMTMSLPPQTHAILLLTQIPQDFKVPVLERVESLVKESDNNYVVETVSGEEYTINSDTVMLPFLTRNRVVPESLEPGTQFLVWTTDTQPDTAYKIVVFMEGQLGDEMASEEDEVPSSPFQAIENSQNSQNSQNTEQNAEQNGFSQSAQGNGWNKENGSWYYYENGARRTGWVFSNGSWYYLNPESGAMQTGFVMVNGNTYYMMEDGKMLTSPRTFTPDENGALH